LKRKWAHLLPVLVNDNRHEEDKSKETEPRVEYEETHRVIFD
jgi:hypothetical protein